MTQSTEAPKPATQKVCGSQNAFAENLPIEDHQDFEDVLRGLIDQIPDAEITNEKGRTVWSLKHYDFLNGDVAPDSVNPSLWRMARLNTHHGLFEVVPGVYQIRGMDLANMTLVEGEGGIIVIDALSCMETARAALALYRKNRGERPVKAVVLTHTHADHWGGVLGVASAEDYASGKVPLLAPEGFMEHAVSENLIAGNAMRRRASYQFGIFLPPGPRGQVGGGLGQALSIGRMGLAVPNDLVRETGETREYDGVTFEFQMAPETEAPVEMHIFTPKYGVLNMADNAIRSFHNLLPFRGSQVRNSLNWTNCISEALDIWGDKAEVLIGQHHWPVWGKARVLEYLKIQRDLYKFAHDQTLRLINQGYTPHEIAEELSLPASLEGKWYARGYYGSLRHNVKAIYQHYMGWYDAVPAHLDPLPPSQGGAKTIEYMGGIDSVVEKAKADFEAGNFRWVAQVMNDAVFAEPDHAGARALLADAYEQLGYLAESSTWRNSYLCGAQELRHGVPPLPSRTPNEFIRILAVLSSMRLFEMLGTRLDPTGAQGLHIRIALNFTDREEHVMLNLENCALTTTAIPADGSEDLSMRLERAVFDEILAQKLTLPEAMAAGKVTFDGDILSFKSLFGLFGKSAGNFAIVEP